MLTMTHLIPSPELWGRMLSEIHAGNLSRNVSNYRIGVTRRTAMSQPNASYRWKARIPGCIGFS
jgi:hypothetical protein